MELLYTTEFIGDWQLGVFIQKTVLWDELVQLVGICCSPNKLIVGKTPPSFSEFVYTRENLQQPTIHAGFFVIFL